MKPIVIVGLLSLFVSSLGCDVYQCGALSAGTCASLSNGVVTVNQDGCPTDKICYITGAMLEFSDQTSGTYQCWDDDIVSNDEDAAFDQGDRYNTAEEWQNSPLCVQNNSKNLASDNYDTPCESDDDCELADGTNTECVCALDGNAYCRPHWQSDYFQDWYDLCDAGDANEIYYEYYRFQEVYHHYVYKLGYSSDVDCLSTVAYESLEWREIEKDYDNEVDAASSLVIASFMALLLLA